MGLSAPSDSKAAGASPLTLACARHGRPLRRAASDVGTLLSLLCLRRGVWGHSSRCFAFGGVSPLLSSASPAQIASIVTGAQRPLRQQSRRSLHPSDIVFPRRNSRSLHADRPFAPGIEPNSRQFRDIEDLTGYWIGGLRYTRREGRL